MSDASFHVFKQFNVEPPPSLVSSRSNLTVDIAATYFAGSTMRSAIVRALAEARCIRIKEVIESFEVFHVVRKFVRQPVLADLCCGHGLIGMLMAVFERRIDRVHLCDAQIPESSQRCLDAIRTVAPWIEDRVVHHEGRLERLDVDIDAVLATHACGDLTDRCLTVATERSVPVAVTPCCYAERTCRAPEVLQRELGLIAATDTDRTYRLQAAGYTVRWRYVPAAITPMNRVLIATR